ncbi:hypothetical protein HII31_13031 [Pseudocercospora fuligena]|uniref:Uncharacterized protein n=1 Tax=Pseudocercospora fuligena TaxID=685502 RepID=A0A8H6R6T2_9PEZI|nr:hypothetical protein HII31_13031 [Pseudocercospora fuligena]
MASDSGDGDIDWSAWEGEDMAFENLSFDELVADTGRITWSKDSLRIIYSFCAKKQISSHNYPTVEELAELLNLLQAPTSHPDAFQNVGKRVLSALASRVSKLNPALTEIKDATGQWTCLWAGWSKRWYKNSDWDGDISIPNNATDRERSPRQVISRRHTMGTTSLLKALVKHQAEVMESQRPVSGVGAEGQDDNSDRIMLEKNAQILALQVEKEALQKQNSDLKDKSKAFENRNTASVSNFNARLAKLQDEMVALEKLNSDLNDQNSAFKNQITALKENRNESSSVHNSEIIALKRQIMLDQAKVKTELDRASAEIANYKTENDLLATSIKARDEQIDTQNMEAADYDAEKRVLTSAIRAKDRQIEAQQKQVHSLSSDVNALTIQVSGLQAQLEKVSGQYGRPGGLSAEHIRLENAYNDDYPDIAKQVGDDFTEKMSSPASMASTVISPVAPARAPRYAKMGMFSTDADGSPTPQTPITTRPIVQHKINKDLGAHLKSPFDGSGWASTKPVSHPIEPRARSEVSWIGDAWEAL